MGPGERSAVIPRKRPPQPAAPPERQKGDRVNCAPLRPQFTLSPHSVSTPEAKSRTVIKNAYEAEYQAAQAKAQTPEYAQVRQEHPAIERKLSELVRRHDIRHARYRGLSKVLRQALLTCMTVNLKRIVKLRTPAPNLEETGTVRAELVRTE